MDIVQPGHLNSQVRKWAPERGAVCPKPHSPGVDAHLHVLQEGGGVCTWGFLVLTGGGEAPTRAQHCDHFPCSQRVKQT